MAKPKLPDSRKKNEFGVAKKMFVVHVSHFGGKSPTKHKGFFPNATEAKAHYLNKFTSAHTVQAYEKPKRPKKNF